MDQRDWLAERFDEHRPGLRGRGLSIVEMDILADPERLREVDPTIPDS